jgi:hypothetical protein
MIPGTSKILSKSGPGDLLIITKMLQKIIIPANPQPEIKRMFGFFLIFIVFFGFSGVYIIPNWLIKVPGHFGILFG